jgi:RND family efflux transporter MFP subunit
MMTDSTLTKTTSTKLRTKGGLVAIILLAALAGTIWKWPSKNLAKSTKVANAFPVVSALATQANVPIRLNASGTASALQSIDIHAQINSTIQAVHVKEGQIIHKGELLFTLDSRTEEANLKKSLAALIKDRADLLNAEHNLDRTNALFKLAYVAQSELDAAQNAVDGLRGQLATDSATVEINRVTRSFDEISAPISGRIGVINAFPGSFVQPSGPALLNIVQIEPINISFSLPERELTNLQQAMAQGKVSVNAGLQDSQQNVLLGQLVFIDNTVDIPSGSVRLKAVFNNAEHQLWPGMFANISLSPRTLKNAITVPAQAIQTGPENKFIYLIGHDSTVSAVPIKVVLIQEGIAVVDGIKLNDRVVIEGAQNLRPGSLTIESDNKTPKLNNDSNHKTKLNGNHTGRTTTP